MELSVETESPFQYVTWNVPDFFQLLSKLGDSLNSPEFCFADERYCLRLYRKVDRNRDTVDTYLQLVKLTSTILSIIVSYKFTYESKFCNSLYSRYTQISHECDDTICVLSQPLLVNKKKEFPSENTLTVVCSMRLGDQSSTRSRQTEELGTSDAEEKQGGLPGQSLFFSSRWRSSKMDLSVETESPFQYVTWNVPDFFQLLSKLGDSLNSPEFRFADDRYRLRLYRKVDRNEDTVDTYLQLVKLTSTILSIIVSYKVAYRGRKGGCEIDNRHFSGPFIDDTVFCLSRTLLRETRDEFVPDSTLTVVCSMRLEDQSSRRGVANLQSDYRRLLQKGAESDMCFVVSGKEFRAHRCVLLARSTVFEAMFRHETAEKESGRVVIDDLDPESFGEFLEYLYTGNLEAGFSDENAFGLYVAADKYDVPTLKSECVAYMRSAMSMDSFCDIMTLALRHREEDLLQQAIQFFRENLERIIVTAKWEQFVIDNGTTADHLFTEALVS